MSDIDVDGDLDLASASEVRPHGRVAREHIRRRFNVDHIDFDYDATEAQALTAGDLDGDGDPDLASASHDDDTLPGSRTSCPRGANRRGNPSRSIPRPASTPP